MRIAVTSQNLRTVTGHAGRARRFLIFDVQPDTEPVEMARLELPKELSMHEFHGSERHPLDDMDVLISAAFGEGFARRMGRRGIKVAQTTEDDPAAAVRSYAATHAAGFEAPIAKPGCAKGGAGSEHKHRHQHHHGCGCSGSHPE